ncbi:MAG TPA: hypothetical protein VJJ73_00190, partial [Candidatus Paceibacterota bacterium]
MPWSEYLRRRLLKSGVKNREIDPDEIFLDSSNLPEFDRDQFEGRFEKPLARRLILGSGIFFCLVGFLFLSKIWILQVKKGEAYAIKSENNRLRHTVLFSDRGIIYDRR